MESWENKILADKLNSLQDLPAGYTPNLSAKWEIVEAGLPAGNKRRLAPIIIRWSVAAAVLLAIGLLCMNTGKKEVAGLAVKEQAMKPTVVFQQKQSVEAEKFPADAHSAHLSQPSHPTTNDKKVKPVEEIAYQLPPETATIPVWEDTNWGSEELVLRNDSLPITIQQADIATVSTEKKAGRKKIYQRDFNDGVLVMDTGFAPSSRQHFSIQLNPFSRKPDDGELPAHRLQLKQAL